MLSVIPGEADPGIRGRWQTCVSGLLVPGFRFAAPG